MLAKFVVCGLDNGAKCRQACLHVCPFVYLPVLEMLGGLRGPVPQILKPVANRSCYKGNNFQIKFEKHSGSANGLYN